VTDCDIYITAVNNVSAFPSAMFLVTGTSRLCFRWGGGHVCYIIWDWG